MIKAEASGPGFVMSVEKGSGVVGLAVCFGNGEGRVMELRVEDAMELSRQLARCAREAGMGRAGKNKWAKAMLEVRK